VIQSTGDGTYVVTYTPEEVGQYTIVIKFAGQELPSGPFHVNTAPSGDASKVKVPGQETDFFILLNFVQMKLILIFNHVIFIYINGINHFVLRCMTLDL